MENVVSAFSDIEKRSRSGWTPAPCIIERFDAGVRAVTIGRLEEDVVGGVRIEGRVEIDEIDAGVRDMLAQHREIIAVIETIHLRLANRLLRAVLMRRNESCLNHDSIQNGGV